MNYIVAIAVGFTIIVSMVQNSRLSQDIDLKQVTLLNFITGFIGALLYFLLTKQSFAGFSGIKTMPYLGYMGGAIGVIVVTLSTIAMKKVSVIAAAMLMYTGQLLMGILIDYGRGTQLSLGKVIGCALIIAGVYFNSYIDNKNLKVSTESS